MLVNNLMHQSYFTVLGFMLFTLSLQNKQWFFSERFQFFLEMIHDFMCGSGTFSSFTRSQDFDSKSSLGQSGLV